MRHDTSTCGGPRTCTTCRSWLDETPEQAAKRLSEENRALGLRFAAVRFGPDPYAEGLATLRAKNGDTLRHEVRDDDPRLTAARAARGAFYEMASFARRAAAQPAYGDVYTNPPSSYDIAIAKLKKEAR